MNEIEYKDFVEHHKFIVSKAVEIAAIIDLDKWSRNYYSVQGGFSEYGVDVAVTRNGAYQSEDHDTVFVPLYLLLGETDPCEYRDKAIKDRLYQKQVKKDIEAIAKEIENERILKQNIENAKILLTQHGVTFTDGLGT